MAMAGHLLQLKQPGRWSLSFDSLNSIRSTQYKARSLVPISSSRRFEGESLRHKFGRRDGFCKLGFGVRAAATGGDAEAREPEVVTEDPDENSSFPSQFKELMVDRGERPNFYLYAAGFVLVVLMRDVIIQEIARWGINFARIVLYIAEGITMGFVKLMEVGGEPVSLLMALATWAAETFSDMYTLIVDSPVISIAKSLLLSLAVVSLGDATRCKVQGPRSQLVGIAAALGVAGVFDVIPIDIMLLSLVAVTAYASFIQKADLITISMPATVTFVTIAPPLIQAAAFGLFLAITVYTNWRSEPSESVALSTKLSPVFTAMTTSICIALFTRFLYLRTVKWLVLRSV